VYGGLRYYDVDADFTFQIPSVGFGTTLGASSSWTDVIIGLRGQVQLTDKWSLTGLADVGGFGIGSSSKLSWQALVTADYAFSDRLTGRIGYRHLGIDNNSNDLDLDLDLGGPVIGLTWAF
jgi:opacity protein-like surface antigen